MSLVVNKMPVNASSFALVVLCCYPAVCTRMIFYYIAYLSIRHFSLFLGYTIRIIESSLHVFAKVTVKIISAPKAYSGGTKI